MRNWHPKPEGILAEIEQDIDYLERVDNDPVYIRNRSKISDNLNRLSALAADGFRASLMREFILDMATNEEAWRALTPEQRGKMREALGT
jgi:hypothetical protein